MKAHVRVMETESAKMDDIYRRFGDGARVSWRLTCTPYLGFGDGLGAFPGEGNGGSEDYHRIITEKQKDRKMIFYRDGLELEIDAAPRVFKTHEGHVVEEYLIDGKKGFFVTLAGTTFCAHGDTLADAIADALWKDEKNRPPREELVKQIREAGFERKITLHEFRHLTGACDTGCKLALQREGLSGEPMTAKEIKQHFPEWGGKLLEILEWEI